MKLAIIRCMQTEDFCPGTSDFKAIREKTGAFEGIDENIEANCLPGAVDFYKTLIGLC